MKYVLLGAFSSGLLLYGIVLLYGALGTTHFAEMAVAIDAAGSVDGRLLVGLALVVAGLGFKLAAVPFHMWAPDVYQGAPLPITAYIAVGSKAAAFALVLRLFYEGLAPAYEQWQMLIAGMAALTMVFGNVVAIVQSNVKRMLAYSSVGQVGFLLMGIAALSPLASNGLMVHLVGYSMTNFAVFFAITAFYNATGKDEIPDFAGLAGRSPFLAAAITVGLFSLAGLPFLAGFVTKFYLFSAAAAEGLLWLAGVAMVASLISLYYYLNLIRQMYIEKAPEDEARHDSRRRAAHALRRHRRDDPGCRAAGHLPQPGHGRHRGGHGGALRLRRRVDDPERCRAVMAGAAGRCYGFTLETRDTLCLQALRFPLLYQSYSGHPKSASFGPRACPPLQSRGSGWARRLP